MNCELIFEKGNGEEYEYCDFVRQLTPSISEQKTVIRSFVSEYERSLTFAVNKIIHEGLIEAIKKKNNGKAPKHIVVSCQINNDGNFRVFNAGYYQK